jgi:hypothetical protein
MPFIGLGEILAKCTLVRIAQNIFDIIYCGSNYG